MNRLDALKVWEDLTRELWPDADVEKSALRIEHQAHVDWLLNDAYDCGCSASLHRPGCPAMKAWEAFDMPEGHAEVGRAFDLARPISTADLTMRQPAEWAASSIEQALMRYYRDPLPAYTQPVINPNDTADD